MIIFVGQVREHKAVKELPKVVHSQPVSQDACEHGHWLHTMAGLGLDGLIGCKPSWRRVRVRKGLEQRPWGMKMPGTS